MNNTNTATQEFAKEFFLLLLDTHKYLKEEKKKGQRVLHGNDSEFSKL